MIQSLKKYWKSIAVFVAVGVVGIPLIIHTLFKINAPCDFLVASWTAGDVLAFYGIFVGSLATIAGVYISIKASNANYREDVIKRSLPFMTVTPLYCKIKNIFDEDEETVSDETTEYAEYNLEKIYFIIRNGTVKIQKDLSDDQIKIVQYGGFLKEDRGEVGMVIKSKKSLYTPLEIENVGNGAAATFSIGVNSISVPENKWVFSLARTLNVGQKYQIAIFSENKDNENCGEYSICISYYDILGNGYEQNYKYTISEDEKKRISACLMMDGTQQSRKE